MPNQRLIQSPEISPLMPDIPINLKCSVDHPHGPTSNCNANASINESRFTWSGIPVTSTALDPNVAQTLALKVNYIIDVRRAKNDLIIRPDYLTHSGSMSSLIDTLTLTEYM